MSINNTDFKASLTFLIPFDSNENRQALYRDGQKSYLAIL